MPNEYWLRRLIADRRLAERTAAQVSGEVRRAYRTHYLATCKKMEDLYLQVQGGRTPGRTKLWEYSQWRRIEPQLRQYCEAQSVIQVEQIDRAMAKVFKDVIGQDIEKFGGDKVLVRYDPRAVIDTAWSGEHFSARVWRNTAELAERIRETAQQIVMGEMSPGVFKRQLMKDYGVCAAAADRLVDTEVSYVLNKANLYQYEGRGFRKLEIVNLDVNTCEKCKALEGEVFDIRDVPVLPIHPRCHCSYCVPEELDEAEITASGANLDEVYARKGVSAQRTEGRGHSADPARNPAPAARRGAGTNGVKGYESAKQYAPKGALERKAREMAKDFDMPEVKLERAAKAAERIPAEISIPQAPAAETDLRDSLDSDIMTPSTKEAGDGVTYLCKLDKSIYSCISEEMVSDEIIITERQARHSDRHDDVFRKYGYYYPTVLMDPDYIFENSNHNKNPNTGIVTKKIEGEGGKSLQIVLRVKTLDDKADYKNSVISSWIIGEKRLRGYLRNRKILYKRKEI